RHLLDLDPKRLAVELPGRLDVVDREAAECLLLHEHLVLLRRFHSSIGTTGRCPNNRSFGLAAAQRDAALPSTSGGSESSVSRPTRGRIRSIQPGSHQFARPSSIITDGTRRQRTIVASIAIAAAMPIPNCLTVGLPLRMKLEKTKTM